MRPVSVTDDIPSEDAMPCAQRVPMLLYHSKQLRRAKSFDECTFGERFSPCGLAHVQLRQGFGRFLAIHDASQTNLYFSTAPPNLPPLQFCEWYCTQATNQSQGACTHGLAFPYLLFLAYLYLVRCLFGSLGCSSPHAIHRYSTNSASFSIPLPPHLILCFSAIAPVFLGKTSCTPGAVRTTLAFARQKRSILASFPFARPPRMILICLTTWHLSSSCLKTLSCFHASCPRSQTLLLSELTCSSWLQSPAHHDGV